MTLSYTRIVTAIAAAFITTGVWAADPVAVVNGKTIPATHAEVMMAEQLAQGAPDDAELREAIREELIRREVLAQAATKAGIEKRADIQAQIELARQAVLIRAYLQDYVEKNQVSRADVEREYESIKARIGGSEYLPRHVLVETENQAKAIIARLRAGEAFDAVATESLDPGSRDRGGQLGWSNPGMFVTPFADAMVKLEKGQFTQAPVQSDFGWHVIMLDDVRELQAPPIEQVGPQLEQRLQQQLVENHLNELMEKASVR